jgi:hypothetical protein
VSRTFSEAIVWKIQAVVGNNSSSPPEMGDFGSFSFVCYQMEFYESHPIRQSVVSRKRERERERERELALTRSLLNPLNRDNEKVLPLLVNLL